MWAVKCFVVMFCFLTMLISHVTAKEVLTVAVASSLYAHMQQQANRFERKYDVTIRLVSGSTGRLYNQIIQGAPFDLFIAADQQRPKWLVQQGRAIAKYNVGQGYLGLKVGKTWQIELKQLQTRNIRHIAMANPKVAPFGMMAKKILQERHLWKVLKHKMVYAQNALQAQMMLDKGLVDAALIPLPQHHPLVLAHITYIGVQLTHHVLGVQFLKNYMAMYRLK